jgi:rhodanese-related sulfurtransferase
MIKVLLLIFLAITISFSQDQNFESYLNELQNEFQVPQISPDSLKNISPVILDTRERVEFDISHIDNAINIGYNGFSLERLNAFDKDTTIVVYCSVGYRSSKIAQILIDAGFNDVRNLDGGIFKWVNQNNEIVNHSIKTDSLHTYNKRWGRYVSNKNIVKIP